MTSRLLRVCDIFVPARAQILSLHQMSNHDVPHLQCKFQIFHVSNLQNATYGTDLRG